MSSTLRYGVLCVLLASLVCSCASLWEKNKALDVELFNATQHGDLELVRSLVKKGASVNGRNDLGETPLFGAVLTNSKEIVEFLIQNGADVNARDANGITPLHAAGEIVGENNVKMMTELLLRHGAEE